MSPAHACAGPHSQPPFGSMRDWQWAVAVFGLNLLSGKPPCVKILRAIFLPLCGHLPSLLTLAATVHPDRGGYVVTARAPFRPFMKLCWEVYTKKIHLPPKQSVWQALHKRYDYNPKQSTDSLSGQLGDTKNQPKACPLKAIFGTNTLNPKLSLITDTVIIITSNNS